MSCALVQNPVITPTSDWRLCIRDAAWMPFDYDTQADTLSFAYCPRDMQRALAFVDRRVAGVQRSPPAPIREISREAIREVRGPLHFIVHTGFCCSTLLARALDIPGVSMGLKEPGVLVSFAQHWRDARQTPGALTAFDVTLDLLSRPLAPGETQIVKPSNIASHLLPEILHLRPDAKVLVLYSDLRSFLEAIVRRETNGRVFGRQVFQSLASAIPLDVTFTPEEVLLQTDLQIAAQAWLMQMTFFASILRHYGSDRVRTLNGDSLLADSAVALNKLGQFFALHQTASDWSAIAAGPVFQEHSKRQGKPFDTDARRAQLKAAGDIHANEINAVEKWAHQLVRRSNAVLTLGDTLLA